jgi:hypothetical protein
MWNLIIDVKQGDPVVVQFDDQAAAQEAVEGVLRQIKSDDWVEIKSSHGNAVVEADNIRSARVSEGPSIG